MLERIQKILSARGVASRRKAEEYIEAGLVRVNGKVAKLGEKADPENDKIEVDGKVLEERATMLYYLMNKPTGVVTSNVERWEAGTKRPMTEGRLRAMKRRGEQAEVPRTLQDTTVRDLLPKELQGAIYPVGRLDKDSGGLLLLTNDGPLSYRLTHPKFDHEKEYEVEVERELTNEHLQKLSEGLMILGTKTKPATVRWLGKKNFSIALTEGKNRQIRRMCEKVGNPVMSLVRTRIMTLEDARLKRGELRPLSQSEKENLLKAVGL